MRSARAVLVALLCAGVCAASAAPVSAVDDRGTRIELSQPASRIVAISPHLAELAFDAGAGTHLVGTVRGSDFPAAAASVTKVGDAYGIDYERLLGLRPDLVLAWGGGNREADIERLAGAGIALFVAEPRRLEDIARHLRALGQLAGTSAIAEAAAQRFDSELARLRAAAGEAPALRVFVEIWPRPLFTVGPAHLISKALTLCGARNALPDYPLPSGAVPLEVAVAAQADAIVSVSGASAAALRTQWAPFGAEGRIIRIDPDLLTRPTPRLLIGVQQLCRRLQVLHQALTH